VDLLKALIYSGPGQLNIQEIPAPQGKTIVEVGYAGICGTDVKTFLKGHPMFKPPTVLGHECIGRIARTDAPERDLAEGMLVAVAPYAECGVCENCLKGYPELCRQKSFASSGSFCELLGMDTEYANRALFVIPDAQPVYTLMEPLACVFNGLDKIGLLGNPERSAAQYHTLIIGGGPMGTLFASWFRSQHLPYAILENNPWRANFLSSRGYRLADAVSPHTYDGIIVAAGAPELAESALDLVKDGGDLLLFAGFPSDTRLTLNPFSIHYREVSVKGSFGYALAHFRQAYREILGHPALYGELVSHLFPLEDYALAFQKAISGEAMKVVFLVNPL